MSDIEEHRKKIEEITLEMIKLLKARTDISKKIGDAKANLGMTVTDEEREDALRSQVTKLCKEIDLDQSTALKFLNLLLNESVKVQLSDLELGTAEVKFMNQLIEIAYLLGNVCSCL